MVQTSLVGNEHLAGSDYSGADENATFREVVGLFTNAEDLQSAIRDLEGTAFPRQDISVMGKRHELSNVFGAPSVDPEIAIDNVNTPRQSPSRPEERTIGKAAMIGGSAYVGAMALALAAGAVTLPAVAGVAVLGGLGGGTIGAVLTKLLGDRYNRNVEEQIEKGGLLLWVRTPSSEKEEVAKQIMIARGGYDVHVQNIENELEKG